MGSQPFRSRGGQLGIHRDRGVRTARELGLLAPTNRWAAPLTDAVGELNGFRVRRECNGGIVFANNHALPRRREPKPLSASGRSGSPPAREHDDVSFRTRKPQTRTAGRSIPTTESTDRRTFALLSTGASTPYPRSAHSGSPNSCAPCPCCCSDQRRSASRHRSPDPGHRNRHHRRGSPDPAGC